MSGKTISIKNVDMDDEMKQDAIEIAHEAKERYSIAKDKAAHIKRAFDEKYGPTWHAIWGTNFGSNVTHETKRFIYFYIDREAVLLFKAG